MGMGMEMRDAYRDGNGYSMRWDEVGRKLGRIWKLERREGTERMGGTGLGEKTRGVTK